MRYAGDMEIKKRINIFFPLKCFEMLLCRKYFENKDFVYSGSIGPILGKYARYVIYNFYSTKQGQPLADSWSHVLD